MYWEKMLEKQSIELYCTVVGFEQVTVTTQKEALFECCITLEVTETEVLFRKHSGNTSQQPAFLSFHLGRKAEVQEVLGAPACQLKDRKSWQFVNSQEMKLQGLQVDDASQASGSSKIMQFISELSKFTPKHQSISPKTMSEMWGFLTDEIFQYLISSTLNPLSIALAQYCCYDDIPDFIYSKSGLKSSPLFPHYSKFKKTDNVMEL